MLLYHCCYYWYYSCCHYSYHCYYYCYYSYCYFIVNRKGSGGGTGSGRRICLPIPIPMKTDWAWAPRLEIDAESSVSPQSISWCQMHVHADSQLLSHQSISQWVSNLVNWMYEIWIEIWKNCANLCSHQKEGKPNPRCWHLWDLW